MYNMKLEDKVLRELHRAALEAGRPNICVPSTDLDTVALRTGSREAAQKAVQRLARAERIVRIRKDLLILPEVTGLLNVEMDNLIDAITPQSYLITGGRALEHHHLTDQHFFGVIVLVSHRIQRLSYRGQSATFLLTDPQNIWGWQENALPHYATPERTIVDTLNHPRYAVSLTQSLDALLTAASNDPTFFDRLLHAVVCHRSPSAARRVGLVVERFFGATASAPFLPLIGENRLPVLMRPGGSPKGCIEPKWRVIVNATLQPEKVMV
jgi:predicted transcriptional regulator of viral defense system